MTRRAIAIENDLEATAIRRWPSDQSREWTLSALKQWALDPGVKAVVAVGSSVRDTSTSADVDLVVIYHGRKPALGLRPLDVDVRFYSSEEVISLLSSGHDYLGWALRFGIPLIQSNAYWERLMSEWREKAPWPDAAESEHRAARSRERRLALAATGDDFAANEQLLAELTHLSRARLLRSGVFPASRPELPAQLEQVGARPLAAALRRALTDRTD